MRKRLLIILVTTTLLCSGCQPRGNLAVVNQTDNPITVEYKYKGGVPGVANKLPLKRFERADLEWQSVNANELEFNASTRTIRVVVAPFEVLSIEYAHLNRGSDHDECALEIIKIEGGQGSVSLEGEEILKHFKPDIKSIETFRYQ